MFFNIIERNIYIKTIYLINKIINNNKHNHTLKRNFFCWLVYNNHINYNYNNKKPSNTHIHINLKKTKAKSFKYKKEL